MEKLTSRVLVPTLFDIHSYAYIHMFVIYMYVFVWVSGWLAGGQVSAYS